ncbi:MULTISPECIES: sensor histidine kinase [Colwellia]|uniref:histidine kinase n=1 Tax=Colwellia marinimaniae TaxID=1513592 RepID=A0ABQ0MSA0_9GAMM|nr:MULTISPECIES: HAMP domain-containing sensor histidine kinase [Colwellia]GAW94481.1 PAS domain-containing sensor histidine kinase [Colwellia marinimaniae]
MPKSNQTMSLHTRLVQSIMALSTIILLGASISIIYMVDKKGDAAIASETRAWANILAKNSTPFLESDHDISQVKLKEELKKLITSPMINHIHVYRLNDDGSIEYFTSYNKNHSFPAISNKIAQISQLTDIKYQNDHLELIVKITQGQQTLGYLFIQSSLLEQHKFIRKLTYFTLAFLFLSLLLAFALSQWLFKTTSQPMVKLIDDIGKISKSRNYQTQLARQPYKELDILTKSINLLLLRTDKHISNFVEDHQHTQSQKQALEDRLSARTDALKESNQELLSTLEKLHEFQDQLVETEKMASLGDMVAGIAHEVNTPIGLGVTASSLLADKLTEIKTAFENKTLKSSQLKKFLNDGDENIAIIFRNLERAAKLISSFKKVAVDQSSAESRTFNVRGLVDEVLLTLSAKLQSAKVAVSVTCPDKLYINSKPGPINQILINLILNSIYHAFDGLEHGTITINIMNLSDQLHINYSDDGIGIDESIKNKIFDPFTTTKRGRGGSGLGMHLVFNLVTQALGGHIVLDEEQEQGVSFDITFPVELAAS